ncbi:MAG: DUF6520 family protein [Flavisolibacter sp.]
MRKVKFLMTIPAFILAVTFAFAFNVKGHLPNNNQLNVTAHYLNQTDCRNTATTEQSNCSTSNTGNPCTVLVDGQHIDAYQSGTNICTEEFKQPK